MAVILYRHYKDHSLMFSSYLVEESYPQALFSVSAVFHKRTNLSYYDHNLAIIREKFISCDEGHSYYI